MSDFLNKISTNRAKLAILHYQYYDRIISYVKPHTNHVIKWRNL